MGLFVVYSLGLAIPFLVATVMLDRFMTGSPRIGPGRRPDDVPLHSNDANTAPTHRANDSKTACPFARQPPKRLPCPPYGTITTGVPTGVQL